MRRLVPIALASAMLAACGGGTESSSSSNSSDINSSSSPVSSSPATSSSVISSSRPAVSSVSSTSSSVSPASSSSVASGTPKYSDYASNALNGAQLYNKATSYSAGDFSCATCHGAKGENPNSPIRVGLFSAQDLFLKIHESMPFAPGQPEECEGQCAADITAYILTWDSQPLEVSCDVNEPIGYSPRALKLLTVEEYQNSLEDLINLDEDITQKLVGDIEKGGFPNNNKTNIDNSRANKYWSVAETIAKWAVENNQPFACGTNDNCGYQFINEFLPKMFRRPLTESERDKYQALFNSFVGKEGMEIGLVAALNAPQFLYRSELGKKVGDVLANDPEPIVRPVPGESIVRKFNGAFERVYSYIGVTDISDYKWTGNDVIMLTVKGEPASDGRRPVVGLQQVNNNGNLPKFEVNGVQVLTWEIGGSAGGSAQLHFQNELPNPGNNGEAKLYFGELVIGKLEEYIPSKGDVAKMEMADPNSYILDPYEYASLLSYTLTGSTPDAELLEAAGSEKLHYEDDIRVQVERLLDSPRGRERIGEMAGYWFGTNKVTRPIAARDPVLFPDYTDAVRESMAEEIRQLFRDVVYNNLPFETIYNADYTFLNSVLSDYYGIPSASTGPDNWVKATGLQNRGGVLTSGAFMAVNAHPDKTSPINRAVRVRELMMCQHILPPPILVEDRQALLDAANAEYQTGEMTSRKYYEVITGSRSCDDCHKYKINPMFGMEDFDQVGKWRDSMPRPYGMGPDLPIDTSGILYRSQDLGNLTNDATEDMRDPVVFNGAKDLANIIAELPGAKECLVEKSFRFLTGLPISSVAVDKLSETKLTSDQAADFACVADKAKEIYRASNRSVKAMLIEIVMQDLMRFRK